VVEGGTIDARHERGSAVMKNTWRKEITCHAPSVIEEGKALQEIRNQKGEGRSLNRIVRKVAGIRCKTRSELGKSGGGRILTHVR